MYTHLSIKSNISHLVVATLVAIHPSSLPAYIFLTLGNSTPISALVPPLTNAGHVLLQG